MSPILIKFFGVIMSVQFDAPYRPNMDAKQALPVAKTVPANDFWKTRLAANGSCGMTNVEITRLCTRLSAVGLAVAGIGSVSLAALGLVAWPIGFVAIPCALAAAGLVWYSVQFNDYENPDELEKFRNDAARMGLESVMQTYGWNDVLRFGILSPESFAQKYRQHLQGKTLIQVMDAFENALRRISQCPSPRFDFQVPHPRESARLWRSETATKTFEEILQTYPLEKLEKYSLVEAGELNCLKSLKREYDVIKANRDQRVAQVEREFQASTVEPKRVYDQECARADQVYNNNYAVRELQGFELIYARERQTVQEQQNRSKREARERFERAVARITDNGNVAYSALQPTEKGLYDQQQMELQHAESQADLAARLQIQNIDQRRHGRLILLNTEEARVRQERAGSIENAKRVYDAAVVLQRQRKEHNLGPIESSFRSSASDFNGRYRAYLRTIGVH